MRLTARTVRRAAVAALACAALAVPAIAVAAPNTPATPPPTTAPVCQPSGLVIWLNTSGDAAAGTTYFKLNFTNLSGHTCTLEGFPYVLGVSLSGHQIGKSALLDHTSTPHIVAIGNGKTASAVLGIVVTGNFSSSQCHPVTAAGLKVYAPTGVATTPKVVPFPFGACSSTGVSYLNVQPLK